MDYVGFESRCPTIRSRVRSYPEVVCDDSVPVCRGQPPYLRIAVVSEIELRSRNQRIPCSLVQSVNQTVDTACRSPFVGKVGIGNDSEYSLVLRIPGCRIRCIAILSAGQTSNSVTLRTERLAPGLLPCTLHYGTQQCGTP